METAAAFAPAEPGVNVTCIEQLPPAAMSPVHVDPASVKSAASVPVTAGAALKLKGELPVLVSVTVRVSLEPGRVSDPKSSELGARLTAEARPLPVSGIECGLPPALLVTTSDAFFVPALPGANATPMAQVTSPPIGIG